MKPIATARCSKCGRGGELWLIVGEYSPGSGSGRALVYCEEHKTAVSDVLIYSKRLRHLSEDDLVEVYDQKITQSDPATLLGDILSIDDAATVQRILDRIDLKHP